MPCHRVWTGWVLSCCLVAAPAWAGLPVSDGAPENAAWAVSGDAARFEGFADPSSSIPLVLDRAAVVAGPLTLAIETDATQLWIVSGGALVQVKLPGEGAAHRLTLDPTADGPRVELDGRSLDDQVGRWVRLCLVERDAKVTLKLVGATRGEVMLAPAEPAEVAGEEAGAGAAADPAAVGETERAGPALGPAGPDASGVSRPAAEPTPEPGAAGGMLSAMLERAEAGDVGPASAEEAIGHAKRATFQVQALTGEGRFEAVGTGFLVSADGLAVTSTAALSAGGGFALMAADGVPLALEVLGADGSLGLAAVRVRMPEGGTSFPHLKPAARLPRPGDDVWSLGASRGVADTVVKGVVEVVGGPEVVAALPAAAGFGPRATWLGVAGHKFVDDAGGPLVNAAGELLGVNAPLAAPHGKFYVLQASHAFAVVNNRAGGPAQAWPAAEPATDPVATEGGSGGASQERSLASPLMPLPTLEPAQDGRAGDVERARWRLQSAARSGGPDARTAELAGALVLALARCPETDRHFPQVVASVQSTIDALGRVERAALEAALGEPQAEALSARRVAVGDPVVAVGALLDPAELGVDAGRGVLIGVGDARQRVLVLDPRVLDRLAATRERLIVGGLLTGYVERGGHSVAVLQHGFIRPAK